MIAKITISFVVPAGYSPGDYARLCGNGGSGAVDYNNPIDNADYDLFPNGAGIYGFGRAPFGSFRFGRGHSMNALGFGRLPFGRFPFGHGSALITADYRVDQCGDYKFGFACYDSLGNLHAGTPEETTVNVHIAPAAPTGLIKQSYNKTTDILTLTAA